MIRKGDRLLDYIAQVAETQRPVTPEHGPIQGPYKVSYDSAFLDVGDPPLTINAGRFFVVYRKHIFFDINIAGIQGVTISIKSTNNNYNNTFGTNLTLWAVNQREVYELNYFGSPATLQVTSNAGTQRVFLEYAIVNF